MCVRDQEFVANSGKNSIERIWERHYFSGEQPTEKLSARHYFVDINKKRDTFSVSLLFEYNLFNGCDQRILLFRKLDHSIMAVLRLHTLV